ncbi:hypothetical protein FO519_005039 [Halicephalobus sp. NKZ332]|nr:hypothetical protein FO519_005039 [Halicephalobus sp. NKZ332]
MTSIENSTNASLLTIGDPEDNQSPNEEYIIISVMFAVGVCGLTANITAIRIIWKSKNLHNCFGYLLLLHASVEAVILFSFVFWSVPTTLFDRTLSKTTLGIKIGHVVLVCYYATLYSQLFNAINRFFAIASPVSYRNWFSVENAKFILGGVMFISLLHGIVYLFPECNFYYDGDALGWLYEDGECYYVMTFYCDFMFGCVIAGMDMFIDTCTFLLILKSKLFAGKDHKDIKFFAQNCSISILYTIMLIIVELVSTLNDGKWYGFWTVTFVWELCHTVDG